MATRQTAPGKPVDNRKSSISLCISTADSSICTSAQRPERELQAVGEAPLSSLRLFLLMPCSASCLDETCFQDTDEESTPFKELKVSRKE